MIHEWREKINPPLEWARSRENEIFIILFSVLLVLTIVGGFKFYELQKSHTQLVFQKQAFSVPAGESAPKLFMASKNSNKYYPVNCKSVPKIGEENKLYFVTEVEAQKAGFSRSKSCP